MSLYFLTTLGAHLAGNSYVSWRLLGAFNHDRRMAATWPWFVCMGLWPLLVHFASGHERVQGALFWAGNYWLPFAVSVMVLFCGLDTLRLLRWGVNRLRGEQPHVCLTPLCQGGRCC